MRLGRRLGVSRAAGHHGAGRASAPLRVGEAVRVMTGAPLPAGTEAIVPVEDVERRGETSVFRKAPPPGAHLRRRAEIFRAGERVLRAGDRLSLERILGATVGAVRVAVTPLPRCVALAATGDEIVDPSTIPVGAQIRNGNGPAIAAALARRGIRAAARAAIPDRLDALKPFFGEESANFDLLVTTGGVSVGDYDRAVEAATGAGFEIVFHGVAVKPGKPVASPGGNAPSGSGCLGIPSRPSRHFTSSSTPRLDRLRGSAASGSSRLVSSGKSGQSPAARRIGTRLFVEDGQLRVEPIVSRGSHDILAQAARTLSWSFPPRVARGATEIACAASGGPGPLIEETRGHRVATADDGRRRHRHRRHALRRRLRPA